jgi:hypothetical protein
MVRAGCNGRAVILHCVYSVPHTGDYFNDFLGDCPVDCQTDWKFEGFVASFAADHSTECDRPTNRVNWSHM